MKVNLYPQKVLILQIISMWVLQRKLSAILYPYYKFDQEVFMWLARETH